MVIKPTKLLILVNHIDGGTGTFVFDLIKLKKIYKDLKIEILILGKEKYRLTNIYKTVPIKYFRTARDYPEYYSFNHSLFRLIVKELLWLKSEAQAFSPHIILSIDSHCNLLAGILKRYLFTNTKLIITNHNNLEEVMSRRLSHVLKYLLKKLGGFFFNNADAVVCLTEKMSEGYKQFFSLRKKVYTIPYGIDLNMIKKLSNQNLPAQNRIMFNLKKKKIVSIGRFEFQKDFDTLINAFYLVYKKHKNIVLFLIGDGSERNKLQKRVRSLKLDKVVYFLGWKENVFPYLKHSDIFVLSSHYEGFGYVLLEAMALGKPVLSTNSPIGPSEILDNGTYGVLAPVGNENSMAKAMNTLLNNKKKLRYYAKKSKERIKNYTIQNMLFMYKKLITHLVT